VSLLNWVPGRRIDQDALRAFECTQPLRKFRRPWGGWDTHHPAHYELVVQGLIRSRLKPVGEPGRTVLLGWDARGDLGGVSTYRALGSASFNIDAIAVAQRFRHRGGGWALEALSTTLDYITADADGDGYTTASVAAQIHEDNRPSQRLFESQRFEQTDVAPDGYQVWAAVLVVEGAVFDA
jgi:RimJ/RimL family protein N-acetyltransferase